MTDDEPADRSATARLMRSLAAGVAVIALLLQVLFATPLAMRMASHLTLAGVSALLCATATDGPVHQPQLPAAPHDHGSCLLCAGHLAPLVLLAAAIVILASFAAISRLQWHPMAIGSCGQMFPLYLSRAPPAAA